MTDSILMNIDKQLILSTSNIIRQHDIGAEIDFLVPINLSEGTISSSTIVTLKVLNIANQLFEYALTPESETYKDAYLKYKFTLPLELSLIAGELTLMLTIKDSAFEVYSNELKLNIEKVSAVFQQSILSV